MGQHLLLVASTQFLNTTTFRPHQLFTSAGVHMGDVILINAHRIRCLRQGKRMKETIKIMIKIGLFKI